MDDSPKLDFRVTVGGILTAKYRGTVYEICECTTVYTLSSHDSNHLMQSDTHCIGEYDTILEAILAAEDHVAQ